MDNIFLSDPDSQEMEIDLSGEQVSCLHFLRSSSAIGWGFCKKAMYASRRVKEMKSKMSLIEEGESKTNAGESSKLEMKESEEVEKKRVNKREREGSSGENERKPKKNPSTRWTVARLRSAERMLLEVVREMNATWDKPVLRHDLREKARKQIGDTGLLDHLLKHMTGEILADGQDRLVRRHNSEGAIEYWLEPAELERIRQEAGILDPYWIPPPGWKLGDPISGRCNCDGDCKEIISQLKEELNLLKSEIAELKETEKSPNSWQEKYKTLFMQLQKLQEQVTDISISMLSLKEENRLLKEEKEKRRKEELTVEKGKKVVKGGGEVGMEEKKERKSGFNICKPEGTFFWPPQHATSSASPPPQLVLLPSPTSPLLAYSPTQILPHRPVAMYPFSGMINLGASSQVECVEMEIAMAHSTKTNSEKRDDVSTDLALASLIY